MQKVDVQNVDVQGVDAQQVDVQELDVKTIDHRDSRLAKLEWLGGSRFAKCWLAENRLAECRFTAGRRGEYQECRRSTCRAWRAGGQRAQESIDMQSEARKHGRADVSAEGKGGEMPKKLRKVPKPPGLTG